MKFGWMREEERLIKCRIVHRGAVRDLELHHLTAGDIEQAEALYPTAKDADPQTTEAQAMKRVVYLVTIALGPEAFEARDPEAQMKELVRSGDGFSKTAILQIFDAAHRDSILTPEVMEAAKDGVRPTESAA